MNLLFGQRTPHPTQYDNMCNTLKVIYNIKNKKYPFDKTVKLLSVYIPGIKEKINKIVNERISNRGIYGQELQDYTDIVLDGVITNFMIDNMPIYKASQQISSGGKKPVTKKAVIKKAVTKKPVTKKVKKAVTKKVKKAVTKKVKK